MKRLVSFCLDWWCLWMLWSQHPVKHKASAFAVPHTGKNRRHFSFSALLIFNFLKCLSTTNGVLFLPYTTWENYVSFMLIRMSEVNKEEEKNRPEANDKGVIYENIVCLWKDLPSGSTSVLFWHIHSVLYWCSLAMSRQKGWNFEWGWKLKANLLLNMLHIGRAGLLSLLCCFLCEQLPVYR